MRICIDCSTEHFPRTNPVAIAVVADGDRCLLGRNKGWPGRLHSALAGFIEPGETIMIGCIGQAESTEIQVDDKELESAEWFDRGEVAKALAGASDRLRLPSALALAHHLIQEWLDGEPHGG